MKIKRVRVTREDHDWALGAAQSGKFGKNETATLNIIAGSWACNEPVAESIFSEFKKIKANETK